MSAAKSRAPWKKFYLIVSAGIFFQAGVAAIDNQTLMAVLVFGLTGSAVAVGATAAISRYGWLFPQLIVAYLAQRHRRRMKFYLVGAFGRVIALTLLALLLGFGGNLALPSRIGIFFVLWTFYAFIGGIVAVPYNDIVARSVPSSLRSRLLALRFFGGGLMALGVAGLAHRILAALPFPENYGLIVLCGALFMLVSSLFFLSAGEDRAPPSDSSGGFLSFLGAGFRVLREDSRFRRYLYTRWFAAGVSMAWPFYILQVAGAAIVPSDVALFFALQTLGALLSNPLWGWWGDRLGKGHLLIPMALLGVVAPLMTLVWLGAQWEQRSMALVWFGIVFAVLGSVNTGDTIAHLGYLWEISPNEKRPAYSGYFGMFIAPAALLPFAAAFIGEIFSFSAVFTISLAASLVHMAALRRLLSHPSGETP